jgi:hypothetical protein
MTSSTFETLPDEILMIIIRYSGDIFTIFQAFSGLNQRINNILIDKRMHLLTDFLFMNNGDVNIDYYYKSDLFHDICQQLSSLKIIENGQQLRQYLQPLVAFHIQHKYKQSADQIELGLAHIQSIRMYLTDDEIDKLDAELEEIFMNLKECSEPMKNIKRIQSLVLTKGARLECPDLDFNLADAVKHLLIENIDKDQPTSQQFINSLVQMFKSLIISNLKLLNNRSDTVNGGYIIYFFLFYAIYQCQSFNGRRLSSCLNIQYYQAVVDLLIFVIQCLNYERVDANWGIYSYLDLLEYISPIQFSIDQEIFVYTSQNEILKILFDENILNETMSLEFDSYNKVLKSLSNLFTCYRLDMILSIFHYNEHIRNHFQSCWNDPKFIGITTGNPMRRQAFHTILNDISIGTWLATTTNLLFVLLQKKECKLIKKLFNVSPSLIHRLDEDGNDPLLYICLKVRGCRHRLIEYLIKIGCDIQRRNSKNENFIDTLQLKSNRKLLKTLIEHEIIQIDSDCGEIKINFVK